jgi:hypothetical protein
MTGGYALAAGIPKRRLTLMTDKRKPSYERESMKKKRCISQRNEKGMST